MSVARMSDKRPGGAVEASDAERQIPTVRSYGPTRLARVVAGTKDIQDARR
jgi:hypothetical protein